MMTLLLPTLWGYVFTLVMFLLVAFINVYLLEIDVFFVKLLS